MTKTFEMFGKSRRMAGAVLAAGLFAASVVGAAEAQTVWKLHGDQAVSFWWSEELVKFTEYVDQNTGGSLKLEFYPSSSLGVAPDAILAPVSAGTIEVAEFVASYVAGEAAYLTVLGLPMIASSQEQGKKVMEAIRGAQEKELSEKYGVRILASLTSTPLQLFLGKAEFTGPESIKGLRVRTLGPDQEFFLRSLGAEPINVPVAEMTTALATNRVDGVIAGTQYFVSQKFNEFGSNMLAWNAFLGAGFLIVSEAKWSELTPEQQDGLSKAAKQFQDGLWARAAVLEEEVQKQAEAQGFIIHRLTEEQISALTEVAEKSWESWRERSGPLAGAMLDAALAAR